MDPKRQHEDLKNTSKLIKNVGLWNNNCGWDNFILYKLGKLGKWKGKNSNGRLQRTIFMTRAPDE